MTRNTSKAFSRASQANHKIKAFKWPENVGVLPKDELQTAARALIEAVYSAPRSSVDDYVKATWPACQRMAKAASGYQRRSRENSAVTLFGAVMTWQHGLRALAFRSPGEMEVAQRERARAMALLGVEGA